MVRHPRRSSLVPQLDSKNLAYRDHGLSWRWALAVVWLSLTCFILRPQPVVHAQDVDTMPTDSHTLYLPLLTEAYAERQLLNGHGDWPAGQTYTVRTNDTLLSVALEVGLDLEQMVCLIAPTFAWEQPLVIGDTLHVPDIPFACHQVEAGETLAEIAEIYNVTVDTIKEEVWNELNGEPIPGHNLRVPLSSGPDANGGKLALTGSWIGKEIPPVVGPSPNVVDTSMLPADWPYGSGEFAWPTYGWITQGYHVGHSAIDIAAYQGTPVTAADRGVVIRAGLSTVGYGQFVVIDHNIDYITLYAHLSEIYVEEGQIVTKGQLLGRVGSTGNSTGPHLHFEIRDFGTRVDPLTLLPH